MFETIFLESPNLWEKGRGWHVVGVNGDRWRFVGAEWPSLRFAETLKHYFNDAKVDIDSAERIVAELQAPPNERKAVKCRDNDAFLKLVFLLRDGETPQEILNQAMSDFLREMRTEAGI